MLIMRKLFRFEKLGIIGGGVFVLALVNVGYIVSTSEDIKSLSDETKFLVFAPIAIAIGIFITCGVLEHVEHKKAGWKRKDRGSLPRGYGRENL